MKIIKTKNSSDTLLCPPVLICSDITERIIKGIHRVMYGDDWYVVDPLGDKQVLCIMFNELPFSWLIKLFIKKETDIVEYSK